jgi:hypothetical protein
MKIVYTPNPLSCKITLDQHEKKILKKNIYIDDLEDIIVGAHVLLEKKELEKVQKELDLYMEEFEKLRDRVEVMYNDLIEELQGTHVGDCTHVACSCIKCYAEEMAEVPDYLHWKWSNSRMYNIQEAFRNNDDIDVAIEKLKDEEAKAFMIHYKKLYNRQQSLDVLA